MVEESRDINKIVLSENAIESCKALLELSCVNILRDYFSMVADSVE
jgi:hypothetical protein